MKTNANSHKATTTQTTDRVIVHHDWGIYIVPGLGSQMPETDAGKLEAARTALGFGAGLVFADAAPRRVQLQATLFEM